MTTKLTKFTRTGELDICDFTQTGAAGSSVCAASVFTGNTLYEVTANGEVIVSEWLMLNTTTLGNVVDFQEGGIWTVAIINIAAMVGAMISPAGAMISLAIALIFSFSLSMFSPITLVFTIVSVIVGLAIGMKVRN